MRLSFFTEPLLRKQQIKIPQNTVEVCEHSKYHGVICENNNLFGVEVPELDEWREETIIPKPITSQEARILLRGGLSSAYEAAQIYTFMVRCIYGKNEVIKLHKLYNEMQNYESNAATMAHLGEESQDNTITTARFHFDEEGTTTIEEDTTNASKAEEGTISSDKKIVTVTKASSDDEEEAAMPSEEKKPTFTKQYFHEEGTMILKEHATTCTKALYQEVEVMLSEKNATATLKGFSVKEDTRKEIQENTATSAEEFFHEDDEMSLEENTTNVAAKVDSEESLQIVDNNQNRKQTLFVDDSSDNEAPGTSKNVPLDNRKFNHDSSDSSALVEHGSLPKYDII